jgi:hypothetical protein
MLSMKVRYHGATVQEMGNRWGRVLAAGLGATLDNSRRGRKKRSAD